MHRTLNCGVGMVICVPASSVDNALKKLTASGEIAFILGDIQPMSAGDEQVHLLGLNQ